MYNAGQSCCAVERVYVHASRYADFVAAARPLVESYVLGDPRVDTTTMGPIAQPWHPEELEKLVADAVARGAKLLVGGHRTQVGGKGRFFEPTMLVDVPQDARLFRQESFGPILAIARVDGDDDALARMNDARSAYRQRVDEPRPRRALARALEFGTVTNRCDASTQPSWTGWKEPARSTLSRLGFGGVTAEGAAFQVVGHGRGAQGLADSRAATRRGARGSLRRRSRSRRLARRQGRARRLRGGGALPGPTGGCP